MSSSVTKCLDCGSMVWAGTTICPECNSQNIAPTLRQVYNYYLATNQEFRKFVEERNATEKSANS